MAEFACMRPLLRTRKLIKKGLHQVYKNNEIENGVGVAVPKCYTLTISMLHSISAMS